MSIAKMPGADAVAVRIIGMLGAVLGACALAAGFANLRTVNPVRDISIFIAIGVYLLVASVGTIALRKVGVVMLVVPLAILGVTAVIGSATQGSTVAVVLNLVVTAPLLCSPAYVVWRNRGALR